MISQVGLCRSCSPMICRDTRQHRGSVAHRQFRRLRALLAKNCMSYTEIGVRLGITRERVRQLADRINAQPHTGWERVSVCAVNRKMAKFCARPFVQKLVKLGLSIEPILNKTQQFSRGIYLINNKRTRLLRCCFAKAGGSPYLVIRKTDGKNIQIYVWELPDGRFLVMPRERVVFKRQTMFIPREVQAGEPGVNDKTNHHYFCHIEAWEVFRGELP